MTDRAAVFEELRPLLFSIAYRMLGSVAEAEDVLQEAFIRWDKVEDEVDSPRAYLSSVVTRLCIDTLRSARMRRETYVGPWLPEPLVTEAEPDAATVVEQADSLSFAFMVVLETLSPIERAVFLLREVFGYDYDEIAEATGKSEANARQIAHRAREHVAARRPRYEVSRAERDAMTTRFLEACAGGEISPLMKLLADDVVLYSDGGGKVRAARRPILGPDKVARFVLGVISKEDEPYDSYIAQVNGGPALILSRGGKPFTVLALDVAAEHIREIHIVVNPDKLERLPAT